MVYILGWIFTYQAITLHLLSGYRGRALLCVVLVAFGLIAFLRGDTGTDTATYVLMLSDLSDESMWKGREPGFSFISWILVSAGLDAEFSVRTLSLIFTFILAVYTARSTWDERYFLLAYVVPAFFYQYSMNALRIGLSAALLLLAAQALRRNLTRKFSMFSAISILFHYSSLLSVFYILSSRRCMSGAKLVALSSIAVIAVGLFTVFANDYFLAKLSSYTALESPHLLSGLRNALAILLVAIGVSLGHLPRHTKLKLITLGISATVFSIGVAQISYAGLRFLDIITFIFPLSALLAYQQASLRLSSSTRIGFLAGGAITAAAIWRGFILEQGSGNSPFLPYQTWIF